MMQTPKLRTSVSGARVTITNFLTKERVAKLLSNIRKKLAAHGYIVSKVEFERDD